MAIRDDIFPLVKRRDWQACHKLLDNATPVDNDERTSIIYWRAVVLEDEGRNDEALSLLNLSRNDFNCKCLPDYMSAKILKRLGRPQDAIAILSESPILAEAEQFPGLAREAAYLYCTLLAESGAIVPEGLLDLIPDSFQTMDDKYRVVGKADLLDLINRRPKTPMR